MGLAAQFSILCCVCADCRGGCPSPLRVLKHLVSQKTQKVDQHTAAVAMETTGTKRGPRPVKLGQGRMRQPGRERADSLLHKTEVRSAEPVARQRAFIVLRGVCSVQTQVGMTALACPHRRSVKTKLGWLPRTASPEKIVSPRPRLPGAMTRRCIKRRCVSGISVVVEAPHRMRRHCTPQSRTCT